MADEEVALSIEETNRLRESLGLKPLKAGPPEAAKLKPKETKAPTPADADEIRAKVTEAREKRRREAELRATKTLGEASEDVDDVASWISKIKPGQAAAAAAAGDGPSKPSKRQRRAAAAADGEEQEHTAADLAGVAVRHDVDELAEGETVVLTLADAGILDEKGNLADGPDQLEDALTVQEKARRKARREATKTAKPLWEEDGKVRGLLDKYDEEEEEAVAAFDASGQLLAEKRQQELHSKLAAGAALLDSAGGSSKLGGGSDYYTAEEAAALNKGPKKKKKRKLRTTKVSEPDEGEGMLDLDALEAAAAAEGAADLGSREAREARRQQQEAARAAAVADRAARFEAALGRANIASAALRQTAPGAAATAEAGAAAAVAADADLEEVDDELAASLARARRLAQKVAAATNGGSSNGDAAAGDGGEEGGLSVEEIARQLAKKREEDEEKLKEQLASGATDAFTETTEFVRSIQVAAPKAEEDGSYMDVDEPSAAAAAVPTPLPPPPLESKPPVKQQRKYRKGGWVSADGEEDEQQGDDADAGQQPNKRPAPELEDTGVVGERAMGKGLAACLGLIKDKGILKDKTQWAGRTNDKKPVALIGLDDVYTGGSHEDAMLQRIEVALTQRDEFGRVMTPKERFRVMCHQFHGKPPSKNKQEERQRKYLEEVAIARATTSDNPSAELDRMKQLQQQTGSAYIPLTGKAAKAGVAASSGRDPLSGLASARTGTAATPVLGGGLTPLAGNRKVEMMLGISKGGSSGSMPPPAPRR